MEKDGADTASGENTRAQQARHAVPRTYLFTAARLLSRGWLFPLCPIASVPSKTTASDKFPFGDWTSIHSLA